MDLMTLSLPQPQHKLFECMNQAGNVMAAFIARDNLETTAHTITHFTSQLQLHYEHD